MTAPVYHIDDKKEATMKKHIRGLRGIGNSFFRTDSSASMHRMGSKA
jgi:hypothetical protein